MQYSFHKRRQGVAPITHTSLSQREVARRSRDGGFEVSRNTPYKERHVVAVLNTSLSQREVARRSRDGGFESSCNTPCKGFTKRHSNPPARLAPTHLPLQKGGINDWQFRANYRSMIIRVRGIWGLSLYL